MPAYNASNRAIVQEIQIWVLNSLHQRLRLRARLTMNFQSPKFPKMYASSNFGSHWKKMCSLSLFVFRWILVHFSFIMWIQRQDWSLCTKFFGSNTLFLGSLYSDTFWFPFSVHGFDLTARNITRSSHSHRLFGELNRAMDFSEFHYVIYSFWASRFLFLAHITHAQTVTERLKILAVNTISDFWFRRFILCGRTGLSHVVSFLILAHIVGNVHYFINHHFITGVQHIKELFHLGIHLSETSKESFAG